MDLGRHVPRFEPPRNCLPSTGRWPWQAGDARAFLEQEGAGRSWLDDIRTCPVP